jgi:hypothetical protein
MAAAKLHHLVATNNAVVGFEAEGFGRHLTLGGKRAFQLSPGCSTCAFLFERIESQRLSPTTVSDALAAGTNLLDEALLDTASALLPAGDYAVMAMNVLPTLTSPCSPDDYFSHESIDLFGLPAYSGVPDSPRIPYWRAGSMTLPPGAGAWPGLKGPTPRPTNPKRFYHFIVPFEPPNWLDRERIAHYSRMLDAGGRPAALGLSVLDVRAPAVTPWDKTDDPDYVYAEHWCLATYLLDGHHKVQAAAMSGHPLGLLAFVSRGASVASDQDVDAVVRALIA